MGTPAEELPATSAQVLAALRAAAGNSADAAAMFHDALKAFKDAGWTWREIGAAAGISHEGARKMAALADGTRSDLGFDVPVRAKALDVIPSAGLHPRIAEDLSARLAAALGPDAGERTADGLTPAVADFFAGLQAARAAGWDNYAIGPAIGLHPRAVSRFAARHADTGRPSPSYPSPPVTLEPVLHRARRPSVPAVTIPESEAEIIRREDGVALGRWYLLGASREELSSAAGADWETVRKRLVRLGFMAGRTRSR